ncbi:Gingipain R, partial [Candidatus Fermentibacteria bacterium]|nr:Gingipain R [Candidatus Fermentibacteria bacterium]
MPRIVATLLFCLIPTALFAANSPALLSLPLDSDHDAVQLLESNDTGFGVAYSFSRIDGFQVDTGRGPFTAIGMPGLSYTTRIGEPKLPVSRRVFSAPLGSEVIATVVRSARQEAFLADHGFASPVMPAQPSLSKSQRPEDVPFEFNEASYAVQGYGDRPLVSVEELGIMRGMRLFALAVEPVRYDPSRHSVEVYHTLEISVAFRGGDLAATRELRRASSSPYYESLYYNAVLNYAPQKGRDDLTQYPIGYIIVANPMFQAQLQPFIEWKTQQGFQVFEGYVGDPGVGSTTATIKNYIQGIYNAQNPKPTFVLFVGDVDQVPAWSGNTGSHVTDVHYVRLVGTDYMPEMYFGRFSARTTAELQPQIDKTLEYERYEMPDPSFLGEAVMISGVDANYAPTYGNGQINYGTTYYFNAAHGIYSHTYLYPASGSSAAAIVNDVSNGVGYANYTAHGSQTSWSNPSFTITNINNLQNASQYPTVVGNCCLTNAFDTGNCFGEAWLRAENKGAIGYIGGTNSTYWDEDFWWGVGAGGISANPTYETHGPGAYDGMFHDHGELFPQWYTTQYGFIMAGNLAVVQGGSSRINYYWEIYSLMGDPSLATYFAVPSANTVAYPAVIPVGVGQIDVSADTYSYVGLSKDGVLYAAGLVDERGQITLEFAPFTVPGQADLVITRQNRVPVITTVDVIPNEGPYVVVDSTFVDDIAGGNGNAALDIGETPNLQVFLTNVGTEPAPSVTGTLATALPQITITNPTQSYGTLPAGNTGTSATPYALQIGSVPDGTAAPFTMAVTSGDSTWDYAFSLVVRAPVLGVAGYQVLDPSGNGNGRPDPGETVELRVSVSNSGSGAALGAQITLGETDPYVTISGPTTQDLGLIPAGMQVTSPGFTVTFSQDCPQAHPAAFSAVFAANAGVYGSTGTLTVIVGQHDLLYVDSDDEATETRITGALNGLGISYRRWNTFETGMATIPLDTLRAYRTVLWSAGDQNTSSVT